MESLYLGKTHESWVQEFANRMEQVEISKEDYQKCRKIYAWLANQIRLADKVRIEEIKK